MKAQCQQILHWLLDESWPARNVTDAADLRRTAHTIAHKMLKSQTSSSDNDNDSDIDALLETTYTHMSNCNTQDSFQWRQLYTDISLINALGLALSSPSEAEALLAVGQLDKAIILAGAPGERRYELVIELISSIQAAYVPTVSSPIIERIPVSALQEPRCISTTFSTQVLCSDDPPSYTAFVSRLCKEPFVIKGFANDWPALTDRPWDSLAYLRAVAGRGRKVPVEVGADYRTDDWTQQLMDWNDFLDVISSERHDKQVLYLAQHDLFKQFPMLRDDISVPDYVYAELPAHADYPDYRFPANEDRLITNVWLGCEGVASPAHTDPFHNLYTQVVGYKTVWLAPPCVSKHMAAFGDLLERTSHFATNKEEAQLSNTSQVDVFDSCEGEAPKHLGFRDHVVPKAMGITLSPGDTLFFPAGWWHAMRNDTSSFSVSMWF